MQQLNTIGDIPIEDLKFFYLSNRLAAVIFRVKGSDFSAARDAFLEAYGQPTSRGPGAPTDPTAGFWYPEQLNWASENLSITIQLVQSVRGSSWGSAFFFTDDYLEGADARDKKKAKARAKGL